MSTKYPTREQIAELCDNLSNGNPDRFFARVSPDVDWELMGRHPLAGRFTSLDEWKAKALQPINAVLKEPLRLKVRNIIGGGDQEWAVVELFADATCKNGRLQLHEPCHLLDTTDAVCRLTHRHGLSTTLFLGHAF